MHINNMDEFGELVRSIKCPLLIFFITRWTKNAVDWNAVEQYKNNINIISIDVGNIPELVSYHRLTTTPSAVLYKDGWYRNSVNGYLPFTIKQLVEYYGGYDE